MVWLHRFKSRTARKVDTAAGATVRLALGGYVANRTHRISRRIGVRFLLAALLVVAGCSSDDDSSSSQTLFPPTTASLLSQLEVNCTFTNDDGTCGQFQLQYTCAGCQAELRTTLDIADEIDPKQLTADFDLGNWNDLVADANDGRLNVVVDDFAKSQLDSLIPKFDDAIRVVAAGGVECHRLPKIPIPICF